MLESMKCKGASVSRVLILGLWSGAFLEYPVGISSLVPVFSRYFPIIHYPYLMLLLRYFFFSGLDFSNPGPWHYLGSLSISYCPSVAHMCYFLWSICALGHRTQCSAFSPGPIPSPKHLHLKKCFFSISLFYTYLLLSALVCTKIFPVLLGPFMKKKCWGSPRCPCRKTLNSPPMNTPNLPLHMKQFPLKKTWKLAEQLLHVADKKRATWRWVGEAETRSRHKPQPWHSNRNREGTHRPRASFWEAKCSYLNKASNF